MEEALATKVERFRWELELMDTEQFADWCEFQYRDDVYTERNAAAALGLRLVQGESGLYAVMSWKDGTRFVHDMIVKRRNIREVTTVVTQV
jgi:hypothetical protein